MLAWLREKDYDLSLEQSASDGPQSPDLISQVEEKYLLLFRHSTVPKSFESIFPRLCNALDFPVVSLRSKAIKAIQEVVAQDPTLLGDVALQNKIEDMLTDGSACMREAAIDFTSKFLFKSDHLLNKFYPIISQRILVGFACVDSHYVTRY